MKNSPRKLCTVTLSWNSLYTYHGYSLGLLPYLWWYIINLYMLKSIGDPRGRAGCGRGGGESRAASVLTCLSSPHRSCLDPGLQLPQLHVAGEEAQGGPGYHCGGCERSWRIPEPSQLEGAEWMYPCLTLLARLGQDSWRAARHRNSN